MFIPHEQQGFFWRFLKLTLLPRVFNLQAPRVWNSLSELAGSFLNKITDLFSFNSTTSQLSSSLATLEGSEKTFTDPEQ